MRRDLDLLRPRAVTLSLLLAAGAYPLALVIAAGGQGLGALAGGCRWIGLSLPLDRQVWALVVEPGLRFASLPRAWPYWLGSLLLPAAVAALALPLVPRRRSLAAELAVLQVAWAALLVGLAVEPMLDPVDGHLARFLHLRRLPPELVWLAPTAAAALAAVPALRLLALLREARPEPPRAHRVGTVLAHLAIPAAGWLAAVHLASGRTPWAALVGAAAPVLVALALAWSGFPPRLPGRYRPPAWGAHVAAMAVAVLAWAAVTAWGHRLPGDRRAGVLWAPRSATDNVRPWIAPRPLPWVSGPHRAR